MKLILTFFSMAVCVQLVAQSSLPEPDIHATLEEARRYLTGTGHIRNESKALELYLQCAEQGSPKAMNALGILYNEGIGTTRNRSKAIEWFARAGKKEYAEGWYNLGLLYKDDTLSRPDFTRAYDCFVKAAALGHYQSAYAQAYLLYKGLGCQQDYATAAALFHKVALTGKPNAMYFWALCLRNGYGIPKNEDSARYWLTLAAQKGYRNAAVELAGGKGENTNENAKSLAAKIKRDFTSNSVNLNQYRKIEHSIPANHITGKYKGYMIRYDWSGQHAIGSSVLTVELSYKNGQLYGKWVQDSIEIPLQATLTPSAVLFKNMQYSRKDYYSPHRPVPYIFENARLEWTAHDKEVRLSGNIQMFSPKRNEPEKPLYISLKRYETNHTNDNIDLSNDDGSLPAMRGGITAYPNPFNNILTVYFELKETCEVHTQLLTLDGKLVYSNKAGILKAGYYTLPLQPQLLTAGTYLLQVKQGKQTKTMKVVKQ